MRALIAVCNPNLPDIAYFSGDETFCTHINQKAKNSGWQAENKLSLHNQVDHNILIQYLQSLIASQQALTSMLNCPYQSLQAEDGSLMVIRQFADHLFIAINGDGSEKEHFLQQKIFILQRLILFLFGPHTEGIRCNSERAKQIEMWERITRMMDTWVYLYHVEQSFLMEAVERLNVNQFLNGVCIELLEKALASSSDKSRVHALLLVKGKLLALFSSHNAPDLLPSNVLMITMITETFYPSQRTFSEENDNVLKDVNAEEVGRKVGYSHFYVGEDYTSAAEDNKSDNTCPQLFFWGQIKQKLCHHLQHHHQSSTYYSPNQGNSPNHSDHEEEDRKSSTPGLKAPSGRAHLGSFGDSPDKYSTPKADTNLKDIGETESVDDSSNRTKVSCPEEGFQVSVFLQQQGKRFVPHRLTVVPVLSGINMVILTAEKRGNLGVDIINAMDLLEKLHHKQEEVMHKGPKHILVSKLGDVLEKDIVGYMKSHNIGGAPAEKYHRKILDAYKEMRGLLNKGSSSDSLVISMEELVKTLKLLFKDLFLKHGGLVREISDKDLDSHLQCQKIAKEKLVFYFEYLAVKGEKNLTMSPFLDKYPGLVHFIHVDRTTNQLTAPSINIDLRTERKKHILDSHRNLVWNFVEKSRHLFQNEHTTVHFQSGDFQMSSFLYFENSMGTILPTPNIPKVPREGHYPGLQAELFFRYITDQAFQGSSDSIRCCELHCIHLAIIPLNVIAYQARKLREQLWEASGVAAAAVNLL